MEERTTPPASRERRRLGRALREGSIGMDAPESPAPPNADAVERTSGLKRTGKHPVTPVASQPRSDEVVASAKR
jgi:hypothetical protein